MQAKTTGRKSTTRNKKAAVQPKRSQIELAQINNMLNTFRDVINSGFSEEGWTLATRIQKNLAGFLHHNEREILSGMLRLGFVGSVAPAHVDSEITKIKNTL